MNEIYSLEYGESSVGYSWTFYYQDGRMITSLSLSRSEDAHLTMMKEYLSYEQLCELDIHDDIQVLSMNGYGNLDGERLRNVWQKRGIDDLYQYWVVQAQLRYVENNDDLSMYDITTPDPQAIKERILKLGNKL